MKNLNPLFLIEALITPEQIRSIKSTHTNYHKLKQIAKKARDAATEARKSGKQPSFDFGVGRRGGRSGSGGPVRFFRGFGETI